MGRHFMTMTIWVGILFRCLPVTAGDKDLAKGHFEKGIELMQEQRFHEATWELSESMRLYPTKGVVYNLANCYRATHQYLQAITLFERLLDEYAATLSASMKKDAKRQIVELGESLVSVTVTSALEDVAVVINGEAVGRTPFEKPLRMNPVELEVTGTKAGFESVAQTVSPAAGESVTVTLSLSPIPARLSVTSNVDGATVWVDDEAVGETPLDALSLPTGSHRIKLVKEGFRVSEQTVDLPPGGTASVTVDLALVPPPAQGPAREAPKALAAEKENETPAIERETATPFRSPIVLTGLVGTVASAGVSGAMWGVAFKKRSDYNTKNQALDEDYDEALSAAARADRADSKKFNRAAVAVTAVTAGFAALLTAGLLMNRRSGEQSSAISATPGGVRVSF